jgi:hypothetical protein
MRPIAVHSELDNFLIIVVIGDGYSAVVAVLCVVDRRWHTMHDYMKALYHRFEAPSRRTEYMDRKIKRTHSQLARLLGKSEKKLLLRIADMEDELRDEACLNSFISGFRLAQGIQRELLADQAPYSFEAEDEWQACEKFSQGKSS